VYNTRIPVRRKLGTTSGPPVVPPKGEGVAVAVMGMAKGEAGLWLKEALVGFDDWGRGK
jgi:hypothetical protein